MVASVVQVDPWKGRNLLKSSYKGVDQQVLSGLDYESFFKNPEIKKICLT